MRLHSVYCIDCARCGAHYESETAESACPRCGQVIVVAWPEGAARSENGAMTKRERNAVARRLMAATSPENQWAWKHFTPRERQHWRHLADLAMLLAEAHYERMYGPVMREVAANGKP